MSAMRLPPLSTRLVAASVLLVVLVGVTAFFLLGVADASDSVTVSHDGFQLTCPGLIAEGSTLTCTLTNTAATEEDWPVVGILHRSADSNRALVRGSPLDVRLSAPNPDATIEGGVWWIGPDLVGYSFFDWSGTAAAASGATTTTTGATTNSRQVVISILDDGDHESEEVFYVSLASDGSRNVGALYLKRQRVRISDGDSKSSDASLSGLRIFAGRGVEEQPLPFSSTVLSYQITVDYDVTEVTLLPTVTRERATVTVNGVQAESGAESAAVHLASGSTSIAVLVTAEDGTSQTYVVAVSRASRPENVEVAVGGFTLSCPSQVVEGSTLTCTLTNTGSDAAPWPVVAIIHSSADDNRALITEDSVIASTSSSYRVDLEFSESQTPERENYKYGYGELFSGGSMSVYTVYGYEKFDWSGEAAANASRTVSIDTKSDDEDENEDGEVFYVALAASDSTGLSGLVDNKAPIVLVDPRPVAPTIDSVTPGDRAITVEWTAPTDATVGTITSYDLRHIRSDASDRADARWTLVSSIWTSGPLEYTLNPTPRLVNGVSYDVQLRAVAGTDQHPWSDVRSATPRTTPGTPMVDTITGTGGSLAVEWQAPGSDGGDEITTYDLRYIKTSEDETIEADWTVEPGVWTSGDLEYDLTGLDDGTRYDVQVRAVNGAGAGVWSAAGVGTTRPGAPAIDSVTGVARGLTVGWSAPALDGDATVTSYDLRYIKTGEDETVETNWTVETGAWISGDLTATVTGLEVGTQYDVQVRAVNASGEGPWSAFGMGTTALSDDATLSALTLSGVRLNPAFSSGMTSYTASVGYTVTRITVAATASDGNASTEILDGNGNIRTDADGAAGFQVNLSPGENVIQVEVTAPDGIATETYGVTVTRIEPEPVCEALWCAEMTVKQRQGGDRFFGFTRIHPGAYGGSTLTPHTVGFGGVDYTVDAIFNDVYDATIALKLSPTPDPSQVTGLALEIDGLALPFDDATLTLSGGYRYFVWTDDARFGRDNTPFADGAELPVALSGTVPTDPPVAEEGLVWSADMLVVEYTSVSIGAASPDLFSNQGGSSGLEAKRLWAHSTDRELYLAFTEVVPGDDDLTLQVGDLALALQPGDSNYTWRDVEVDWEAGQTIPVRLVRSAPVVVIDVPESPRGLAATAERTVIVLSWAPPGDDGGAAVSGYRLEWSADGDTWQVLEEDTAATGYRHSGLEPGTDHHYRVAARNEAGAGPWAQLTQATAPEPVCEALWCAEMTVEQRQGGDRFFGFIRIHPGAADAGSTLTPHTVGFGGVDYTVDAIFNDVSDATITLKLSPTPDPSQVTGLALERVTGLALEIDGLALPFDDATLTTLGATLGGYHYFVWTDGARFGRDNTPFADGAELPVALSGTVPTD